MGYLAFFRANWPFLTAGVLLTLGSSYGQTFFISLFAAQIKEAFGLTDGGWGLSYTLATTASAIVMVWAGTLVDRFRIRALARWVMVGLAVACLMMTQAPGVWWLILTIFFLRLFGQGLMSHLAAVAMARWFIGSRGKALSLSSMGFLIGSAFLPIIFAGLMLSVDWRWLWVLAAILTLAAIPVLTGLLRFERTPAALAQTSESAGMQGRHWTRGEVLRHPVFWLLVPALLGPPAWNTALAFHQVHLSEVKDWSFVSYVALYPFATAVTVAATFASGWAIDRTGSARLLPFYMVPFAICFAILWQTDAIPVAGVALAIMGIGQGLQATLVSAFWAEFFGTRYIGAIKAAAGAIMVFGSAVGPGISGVLIDRGLTFEDQMPGITLYFLLAAVAATLAAGMARRSSAALA